MGATRSGRALLSADGRVSLIEAPSRSRRAVSKQLVSTLPADVHVKAKGDNLMQISIMSVVRTAIPGMLLTFVVSAPALAQSVAAPIPAQVDTRVPPAARTASLSGPRFGLTLLSDSVVQTLEERSVTVQPYISQFRWQVEEM